MTISQAPPLPPDTSRPPGFRGGWYTTGEPFVSASRASGVLTIPPAAVAVPADADDVARIARWAADRGVPLVPRGAGTGMPGGNVGSGVVVDLRKAFRRIVSVDPGRRRAVIEPGVTLAELNAAVASHNLHFPVDPSSGERCTFGGMLANNSAGAHSVRYGATRPWVAALELITADGTQCRITRQMGTDDEALRRKLGRLRDRFTLDREEILAVWPKVRKNSSGYPLREFLEGDDLDLFVGSEGTLALIVAAEVRLAPLPPARGLALIELADLDAVAVAVRRLLSLEPATCELLDRTFLDLVRDAVSYPLPVGLEAVLLVEMEGESPAEVEQALTSIEGAVGDISRLTLTADPEEQRRIWEIRHAASPLIAERAGERVSMQFIEDGVVPISRLPDYIRMLRAVLAEAGLPAVIFGHAGDGNLHVNPLVDVARPGWREHLERVLVRIAEGIAELGGTLAGEHGDGRLRAPLLETIWGREMTERFRAVKATLDPKGILNPGVIIPLPGQRPLDAIRSYADRATSSG